MLPKSVIIAVLSLSLSLSHTHTHTHSCLNRHICCYSDVKSLPVCHDMQLASVSTLCLFLFLFENSFTNFATSPAVCPSYKVLFATFVSRLSWLQGALCYSRQPLVLVTRCSLLLSFSIATSILSLSPLSLYHGSQCAYCCRVCIGM